MGIQKIIWKNFFIILSLGLAAVMITGTAAGQNNASGTGEMPIAAVSTGPGFVPGADAAPADATAEFRLTENIEISADQESFPGGWAVGREWGSFILNNTPDESHTILGNIRVGLMGDSFTEPEFPDNATWNTTSVRWVFPRKFVLNETEKLQASYHTSSVCRTYIPIRMTRSADRNVFISDRNQFNSYTIVFLENTAESYSARVAYEEQEYTNCSIRNETFETDIPLSSLNNESYRHKITEKYISEINFGFRNTSIEVNRPYHINFTAAIRLKNNDGTPVEVRPRIFIALNNNSGTISATRNTLQAVMPEVLYPRHITCATAMTNVSNKWVYRHQIQRKLSFNQTGRLINQTQVGVFRPSNHTFYLKNGHVSINITYGQNRDLPVTGDWNGDGHWDVGVFNRSTSRFLMRTGTGTTIVPVGFAFSDDIPVTGDWNCDGKWEVGVFNKSAHRFLLWNGTRLTIVPLGFALPVDLPVTGDWNGDCLWEVGVFNKSAHRFLLWNGTRLTIVPLGFAVPADIPVTGDWNMDTRYDVGVFNTSTHRFLLKNGTIQAVPWGLGTDIPVTGKWN